MLIPDIVVRATEGDLGARLEVFREGTVCYAHEARFGRQQYRAGAFLPRGRALAASPTETGLLDGRHTPTDRSRTIGIVRLPADLVSDLRAARVGEGQITTQQLDQPPFTRLPAALAPAWRSTGPLQALGYGHTPPGFQTVTFDASTERFIGLHIDDLDQMPLARRDASTTRLCVNLGTAARHLLFINLGVARIVELLSATLGSDALLALRSTPLIHAFLRQFPDYPVVRLAVLPGEAYLAPTENMIHDGSTAAMTAEDQQVTLRGWFEPQ